MADDWQPGDLAMCITTRHRGFLLPSRKLKRGKIYTVTRVGRPVEWLDGERALGLAEVQARRDNTGFPESMFCKIRPHVSDEQDAETIRLLTGAPAKEPAHA